MGLFGAGDPPCPAGSICSGQARTKVGVTYRDVNVEQPDGSTKVVKQPRGGTGIYHASATKLNTDGTATTDVYIIKDGKWQKAATSEDGGKTYTFNDDVAGAGLQKELNDPKGAIHKNIDANINKAADKASLPKEEKDKLVDGNDKKASTEEGDDENKTGDSKIPASETEIANVPAETNSRNSFPTCVYPLDLATTKQDVIRITMLEYVPKDFSVKTFGFSDREKARSRSSIGTVTLPIPGGIQDSQSVQWSGQNMNALEAAAANAALTTIKGGFKAGADKAREIANIVAGNTGETGTAFANTFAGAATGTGSQLLTRTTGAIINPNLELLFNGPSLRTFSFQFKMNARDADESKEIVKILRFFKQGSAPQKSASHLFLKSPHTFLIQYLHRGEGENPFMGTVKECALQSVAVNYTPEGTYATFPDGAMTSYELTLGFSELEPIYNSDYPDDNDASIGF
tara:strand:+ start:61 stop:1437 length:1377 start_codon:yes stop_codon:yes gene_type:complete